MKTFLALVAVAASFVLTGTAYSRSTSSTIRISAHVERFAEWAEDPTLIVEADFSGSIDKADQERIVARTVVLYSNSDTIINVRPGLNAGVLMRGTSTLKTSYRMAAGVENPDATFKSAADFLSPMNKYAVVHKPRVGRYPITLEMKAASPANAAPEDGTYTCGIVLTAAW